MKRIISLMLALMLLSVNFVDTYNDVNGDFCLSADDIEDNIDLDKIIPWQLQYLHDKNAVMLGIGIPSDPAHEELDIDKLYQAGEYYSSDIMQTCGKTIGSNGCILTSFTMLVNYKTGSNYSPRDVNNTLGNLACPFVWGAAGNKYGLIAKITSNPTGLQAASIIYEQIRNRNPVIVFADGHAYLVRGYDVSSQGDLTLIVNDPGSRYITTKDIYAHNIIHKVCYYE